VADPRGPTARPNTPPQISENVEFLVDHARHLCDIEGDRCRNADVRGGGLAILSNGLLAVAATLGGRLVDFNGARWIENVLPYVYGAGLLLLLLAGVSAALALSLTPEPAFSISEMETYVQEAGPQSAEPLSVQQWVLEGWVVLVAAERLTYDDKLRHLLRGYGLFVGGLLTLVVVAITLAEGGS
jgi:MFS family permease